MHLLLAFLFGMLGLGLITDRLDGRLSLLIAGVAVFVTGLYYFTHRFMS